MKQPSQRTGARLAISALVFTILTTLGMYVFTRRAIEQAKADAVASAEHNRRESVRGLCVLVRNLHSNPNSTPEGRQLLTDTYVYLGCEPPLIPPTR